MSDLINYWINEENMKEISLIILLFFLLQGCSSSRSISSKKPSYDIESRLIELKKPTEAAQIAAVKNDGTLLKGIQNPSEAVKLAAVQSSPWAILYIKSPTKRILDAAEMTRIKAMREQLKEDPYPGSYFIHPVNRLLTLGGFQKLGTWQETSETIQLMVVEKYPELIRIIKKPHSSVRNHPKVLAYKKKTYDPIKIARNSNNPSEKILLEAIKKDPSYIKNIENPSEKIQLEALRRDPDVMKYIQNPTKKVIQFTQ